MTVGRRYPTPFKARFPAAVTSEDSTATHPPRETSRSPGRETNGDTVHGLATHHVNRRSAVTCQRGALRTVRGRAGATQRPKAPASPAWAAVPERPCPRPGCRRELGPAHREFTSTATHQPSHLLSGISPKSRAAFCRCELPSPPGSSHLQSAREAGSRELGLCTCVIARSGDVSRLRAARPPRAARGAAEVCGAPWAPWSLPNAWANSHAHTP